MENTVQIAGQQPVISTAGVDIGRLEQWHKEYMAVDGDDLYLESSIILDVYFDHVDVTCIESQIQQFMSTTHVSRGFCNDCQHLFSHWPDLGTESWTHAIGRPFRTHELEAATRRGCKSCSFLLSRLEVAELLDTFRRIEKRLSLLNDTATATMSISNWASDNPQLLWLNLPGKVTKHCNSNWAGLTMFESHVVSPAANCYEDGIDYFEVANEWLRTCSKRHDSCRTKSELKRPTRLLSIVNDVVKLVLTANWETLPQYATLSYCWGCDEFIKLTSDNLDLFLNIIPHEDLPKTFKDAIYIAQRLGLEYIWIDALCIIKDDNGDWLRETARMRSIYGSAHVNIAASSAINVYEGCFSKPISYNGGFLARVTTSEFCRVQNFHSSEVYEESTCETHLASRAWAFQEKLLAPRTIYVGDRGLFWECRSTIRSEFLPDGFPGKLGSHLVCPEGKAWSWSAIVINYSKAQLTNSADKLPALSGVARRQHEATGDEYLAGMWRKGLTKQLGWESCSKNTRPEWRAPTWSWASIDAQTRFWVYWDGPDGHELAENIYIQVLNAKTTLAGSDPFGAVSGGELQLRCTAMVRGHYCEFSNAKNAEVGKSRDERVILDAETQDFPVTMDCLLEDDFTKAGISIYLLPLFGGKSGHIISETVNECCAEEGNEETKNWVDVLMIRGIILQYSGLTKGHFCRIGSFDFRNYSSPLDDAKSKSDHYCRFLRAVERVGASTAESECAAITSDVEHPESRYVITIV